ncbi:Myosin tail [Penicillium chermesinum]|nr:Myosin tail [Penicillium chermesinum]
MLPSQLKSSPQRANPFGRSSPSPAPQSQARPRSAVLTPTSGFDSPKGHLRNASVSQVPTNLSPVTATRERSNSARNNAASGTFAPSFIKSEELRRGADQIRGLEGDNDFSGNKYVWLRDPEKAFVRGLVLEELEGNRLLVQGDDGDQREVDAEQVDKVNPAKFDKADDMAELTHLNEASVVHNLHTRYQSDLIYTYSGLFLVTINPYCPLPIYTNEYVKMYKGRGREDTRPHIFAMADEAFRNLVEEGQNQSILVTGESGAGKTENTKKVIQYLAAVATSDTPYARSGAKQFSTLSQQILRANPILEAFGNAQTVRNNNSSRFGKFIRIEFSRHGQICGAWIDWYLLEKSRVVKPNGNERNYHIFYQLLQGADRKTREKLLLDDLQIEDFSYTQDGNDSIAGVSDRDEWNSLIEAFHVMNFSDEDQICILRTVAAVLHLGNITIAKESIRADQAALGPGGYASVEKACHLLGISAEDFVKGLLHPGSRLAVSIYERGFGDLVMRINNQLGRSMADDNYFIGVLDIAGFEIFDNNSFEQLCINYTNEKLQQFFNHHMFVLEQEEYAREQIEWQFIDFGKDLQPTIDLIELTNPIGIFSCLDEDCVMPKATDKTFTEKLHSLWDRKTPKYRSSRLTQGFVLTHYAAEVEYDTHDWLEKNKDPLNDNITRMLAASDQKHVASLFSDCAEPEEGTDYPRSRVKKGLFRTVAQRHKEQLSSLMTQLHSTHPHFVRCILPNHKKRPKMLHAPLVLDQLRCNGVLEGIRIARTGFPNRLSFTEFRQRYEVLCQNMPKGYLEGQSAAKIMLEKLAMDRAWYRVGRTKVFFRAGVLADLEGKRDQLIRSIMTRFQSLARGFVQRRISNKRLYRAEATRIIQQNFHSYLELKGSPWWQLFSRMKPLLGDTRNAKEVKRRDEKIKELEAKMKQDLSDRQKLDEERRRTEMEIHKIQQTLESERALALDKEEIFRRLQVREGELTEKLAGAIADQESLEEQLDQLVDAKKKTDEELDLRITQLEQAGQIIQQLEAEKKDLQGRMEDLDARLVEAQGQFSGKDGQIQELTQEMKMLQSHLSLKDRKLQDLEAKLLKTDQDLDIKLANTSKELDKSKKQVRELVDENRSIRQQISELSATSTGYEDLLRRKESELTVLRNDAKRHDEDKRTLEAEKKSLVIRHDDMQNRLREIQAQRDAMRSEKAQLEREAADVKRLLEEKRSEDAEAGESRKLLEQHVHDLKAQLFQAEADLSRERQSRDDVQMLAEHNLAELTEKYNKLNESKITIEKEMYIQQDSLRRATEARVAAEESRKSLQSELIKLRDRFTDAESARLNAEAEAERKIRSQAEEHVQSLRRDLDAKARQLEDVENERIHLSTRIQELTNAISESDNFRIRHDQHKERLERELVTLRGRLTASENDNRALLTKIQQKNLDIARSNSRASDNNRMRLQTLQKEKSKLEEDNKNLGRQMGELQMAITSLEKQKEKLSLNLEDLTHEVNREHKTSRNSEKAASTANLQLAEANRNLENEHSANKEIEGLHQQLILLHRVFEPEATEPTKSWEAVKPHLSKQVDLAQVLDTVQHKLQVTEEKYSRAESQLAEMRRRHADEMKELDARYSSSKRALLEEIDSNEVANPRAPSHLRKNSETAYKRFSNPTTPNRRQNVYEGANDSARSDRTIDTVGYQRRMDTAAELEELQNKLQMTEMQNKHLQSQLERSTPSRDIWEDDSPSMRRMNLLERENGRLHDQLDDSAKKVSSLERSIRSGELSLRDVQAKSHEELYDLINSQEQSRRSLLKVHNATLAEFADAKSHFEKLKRARAELEVELRDARSETQELQDFETADLESSLSLYKARADEYFSKLEQAEVAVLKANRAEQFAKSQGREAEETCAQIMSERNQMDALVEDLQQQTQTLEARMEDQAAELQAALQAKQRLQNELEDYRNQRAIDLEDKETSMEQTRQKYQREFSTLNGELEIERERLLQVRDENSRLREELENLRSKWDNEVLNSSTWAKEKARMDMVLQDTATSRDEASKAHSEAQDKVVSLLSQVRALRTSIDDVTAERDILLKDKKMLESRLSEAGERLEDLAKGGSPSMRNAASMDRELLELKSKLAQQEDVSHAAVGKMRRADALATEIQKELTTERETNSQLFKDKAALEKQLKEVQLRLVDLETKSYSSGSQDVRFLHKRIKELETHLEDQENKHSAEQRSVRNIDRTVKDLQSQIDRRDKMNAQLTEEVSKGRDKVERLLRNIEELQKADTDAQMKARRAERELREEREKALHLERELEGLKSLRVERNSTLGRPSVAFSDIGSRRGSALYGSNDTPQRKPSNTKGFL